MTLNNLMLELLRFQMMTSQKSEYAKKSRFKKKDGLQIITRERVRFNI